MNLQEARKIAGKTPENRRLYAWCRSRRCGKSTVHIYVPGRVPADQGAADLRGVRSDYRTVKCTECGKVGTYDFATD